jgi:hypothetical protein
MQLPPGAGTGIEQGLRFASVVKLNHKEGFSSIMEIQSQAIDNEIRATNNGIVSLRDGKGAVEGRSWLF